MKRSTSKTLENQNSVCIVWLNCTCRLFWHRWQRKASVQFDGNRKMMKGQMHSNCLKLWIINKSIKRLKFIQTWKKIYDPVFYGGCGWGTFLTLPAPRENRSQSLLSGPPANMSRPATSPQEWMNTSLSTAPSGRQISRKLFNPMKFIRAITLVFGFITPFGGGLLEGNDCHCWRLVKICKT